MRTVENLIDLYFTSVGRNAKLLLNVPPTRDGLIHDVDASRLSAFRAARDEMFGAPIEMSRDRIPAPRSGRSARRVGATAPDPAGESPGWPRTSPAASAWHRTRLEGSEGGRWQELSSGSTIGHAKLDRLPDGPLLRRVRVVIEEWVDAPQPVSLQLFGTP